MSIVLDGTTGITNDSGYTGDGVSFADSTPANTLVTTSGGNVGIGTSSPLQRLQVQGPTVTQVLYNTNAVANDDSAASIKTYNATTTLWNYLNLDASSYRFSTYGAERMRIDSSGNLLVGATTAQPAAAPAPSKIVSMFSGASEYGINLTTLTTGTSYLAWFGYTGYGVVGTISTNGTTTAYNSSSDYRLKESIQPMTGALAKVTQLKPCTYKWKADGSDGQGFIAHELAEVVPQCVTGEKDAVDKEGKPQYQGVDTSFLVATLVAAIQEQQATITALTARVVALEGVQA